MTLTTHSTTPRLADAANYAGELVDWGVVPTMLEGESCTRGVVIYKADGGHPEVGLWECTPGVWRCHVTADEFCHFLAGRATYTHEDGEVIEIHAGTAAFFPEGWLGTCAVTATVRKVYMIR